MSDGFEKNFALGMILVAVVVLALFAAIYRYNLAVDTAHAEHGYVVCWGSNPQSVQSCEGPACATAHEVCDDTPGWKR